MMLTWPLPGQRRHQREDKVGIVRTLRFQWWHQRWHNCSLCQVCWNKCKWKPRCSENRKVNWPNSQIPQCKAAISNNAPFRTEMCTFVPNGALWDMAHLHCGISEIGLFVSHNMHKNFSSLLFRFDYAQDKRIVSPRFRCHNVIFVHYL